MKVEDVTKGIEKLKEIASGINGDPNGHMEEDWLRDQVLQAIADGADNPQELAKEVLKTADVKFSRWYE